MIQLCILVISSQFSNYLVVYEALRIVSAQAQEVEYRPLNPEEYLEKLPERFVGVDSISFAIELLPKFFGQLMSTLN